MANLEITGSVDTKNPVSNVHKLYGTYPDIATALAATAGLRKEGLTVGIKEAGKVVEYWFETDNITDAGLVKKIPSGGGVNTNLLTQIDLTSITAVTLAAGKTRFNNPTPHMATALLVSATEYDNGSMEYILDTLPANTRIALKCKDSREKWMLFSPTTVEKFTGYFKINGWVIGHGTNFQQDDVVSISIDNYITAAEKANYESKLSASQQSLIDFNNFKSTGLYAIDRATANAPDGLTSTGRWFVIVQNYASDTNVIQIVFDAKDSSKQWVRTYYIMTGGWGNWVKLYNSGSLLAATATVAGLMSAADKTKLNASLQHLETSSTDFNTLTTAGFYTVVNPDTTTSPGANNYGGVFHVIVFNSSADSVFQLAFHGYSNNLQWQRKKAAGGGAWSEWMQIGGVTSGADQDILIRNAIGEIISAGFKANQLLNTSSIDTSDPNWLAEQLRLFTVIKNADGSVRTGTSTELMDKSLPPATLVTLQNDSGWLNERRTLTGDNSTYAIGRKGQSGWLDDSTFVECESATYTTTATVVFRRNRAVDALDTSDTQDSAVMDRLDPSRVGGSVDDGWNLVTNTKVISDVPCRVGTFWNGGANGEGYYYNIFKVSGSSYYAKRIGIPQAVQRKITSASHPTLVGRLLTWDFTTAAYTKQAGDEVFYESQYYYDTATRVEFEAKSSTIIEKMR